ncbi:MAG TPA: hypothetical protein VNV44_13915 [Solirubrobacteraceae bacterium]|jgi:hypothetical protein|nr:hypothetical protein [Solirubrobacteraceae bacterium]
MNGRGVHRSGTLVLSFAMLAIGVALLVESLAEHAAALSGRLLIAVLFVVAGVLRLRIEMRKGRGE